MAPESTTALGASASVDRNSKSNHQFLHLPLNRIPHCLACRFVLIMLPWPKEAPETIAPPAGNDMDVEVWNRLANAVVDCDKGTFGIQGRFHCFGKQPRRLHQRSAQGFRDIEQCCAMFA